MTGASFPFGLPCPCPQRFWCLFLSSRSFTIGNLHKRLTETRLNHTCARRIGRWSRWFVRTGNVPRAGRRRRNGRRSGTRRKRVQKKEGRWTKEGAKPLADGGESLRRVAWQSYRRYHGGSLRSFHSTSTSSSCSLNLFFFLYLTYTYVTTTRSSVSR